ncbi:manganese efflux pump MntP family protein [Ornithinibacillus sp. 4-3]|uniref:Putative manganese efflux pump MntP n=1 Tax=Ornithinibacillus sp. 4-3 TaxID=3231488 RepID=A0AB39HR16_9BACI
MFEQYLGENTSLWVIAIALSLDVFSISLGFGMQVLRRKRICWIGIVFGLFHMILLLLGIVIGQLLLNYIGKIPELISGIILFIIGAQMVFGSLQYKERTQQALYGWKLFLLSFSVSIDSFTVGISLGLTGMHTFLACIVLGIVSTLLAWAGMLIGRKVYHYIGRYSEAIGGAILSLLGILIIFG